MAILFGGDAKHPHPTVYETLREKTQLICVSNGLKASASQRNPLNLEIPNAISREASPVCNAHVSVRLAFSGQIQSSQRSCSFCV